MNDTKALWDRVGKEHCENLWCDYSLHIVEECYKVDNVAIVFLFEISNSSEIPFHHYIDDQTSI